MQAPAVIAILRARELSVATAESLTGGLLCAALTSVPGASTVVRGGIVAYTHQAKEQLLGVDPILLATRGAIDSQVALAMARGARAAYDADVAIATTGNAGPDPSDGQPVGTVFLALALSPGIRPDLSPGGVIEALTLTGTREQIRADTVRHALDLLGGVLGARSGRYGEQ